jgi:folylpolyglutamate synthase/dihydropteroate synthase
MWTRGVGGLMDRSPQQQQQQQQQQQWRWQQRWQQRQPSRAGSLRQWCRQCLSATQLLGMQPHRSMTPDLGQQVQLPGRLSSCSSAQRCHLQGAHSSQTCQAMGVHLASRQQGHQAKWRLALQVTAPPQQLCSLQRAPREGEQQCHWVVACVAAPAAATAKGTPMCHPPQQQHLQQVVHLVQWAPLQGRQQWLLGALSMEQAAGCRRACRPLMPICHAGHPRKAVRQQ